MAIVVEALPKRTSKKESKYPWGEWADGQVWLLEKGEDFTCSVASMRGSAQSAAKRLDLNLSARTDKESPGSIWLQFSVKKRAPRVRRQEAVAA